MSKMYVDTYIYKSYPEYEKNLFDFIMRAERIDTKSNEFSRILYDIKSRKISDNLATIITSSNIVLGTSGKILPKTFKVFPAKDLREDKTKLKVFIDVSGIIQFKEGIYVCKNIDVLISYIINAMTTFIYCAAPNKLLGNSSIIKNGCNAYMKCMSYIFDRLYKISTVVQLRKRVEYAFCLFYQVNILGKDYNKNKESIIANAIKTSGIQSRDTGSVNVFLDENSFKDFNNFIESIKNLGFKDLKVAAPVEVWMTSFGTGTVLGIEYFPTFSAMLTNTYVGAYIDQQVTIEKVIGTDMVEFSRTILQIGASVS